MDSFKQIRSKLIPIDIANIDTDQVIPKQFLKSIQKTGYGNYLFYDWRFDHNGNPKNEFILNSPKYINRQILLTRDNFGCGSSREHAVWALFDYGFRVILAPSFADIFYNNCFKTGMLAIVLSQKNIEFLFNLDSDIYVDVDLIEQKIFVGEKAFTFKIDGMRKKMLLEGLDEISFTLRFQDHIINYEKKLDHVNLGLIN